MKRKMQNNRERGNVLVLVVVVLVLMALIGTTYLQVARVQRAVVAEPIDNIDLILESVIQEIKLQLKADVISETDGNLFGADVEPYDYEITNYASTPVTVAGLEGNLTTQAEFGQYDDAWLASLVPYDWASGTPKWRKITLLSGAYYDGDTTETFPLLREVDTGAADTSARVINNAAQLDTDVNITFNHLVDTDGDGIGDARYERAPIPLMTGHEYFMAVRIIDASSLINLNAATSVTTNGTTTGTNDITTVGNSITGYFPTSLDMSRLGYQKTGAGPGTVFGIFFGDGGLRDANTAAGINGPGTSFNTPLGLVDLTTYDPGAGTGYATNGQFQAWLDGARQPGNLSSYVDALTELWWRGGVNDTSRTSQYETELGDASGEMLGTPYNVATNPDNPVLATSTAQQHFVGSDYASPKDSIFNAIRHLLTTVSGYSVYSPNYDNMHSGFGLMGDVVYRDSGIGGGAADAQTRVDNLRASIENVFGLGTGFPDATAANQQLAAAEFALAIHEYSDPDGTPSANYVDGATTYYGLEALPFIREAYFQVAYADPDLNPATPENWNPVPNGHGFAVEIANPFDRPITTDANNDSTGPNIQLVLIDATTGATIPGSEFPLPDATVIDAIDPTAVQPDRHVLTIISDGSAAPIEDTSTGLIHDDVVNMPAYSASYATIPATADLMSVAPLDGLTVIGVALQVEVPKGSGTWVTYDRLVDTGMTYPATVDFALSAVPPASKTAAYIQKSIKRDDTGVNFISNFGKATAVREPPTPAAPLASDWPEKPGDPYNSALDLFETGNGIAGEDLSQFQIPMANRPIFSVAELGWIHMFGFSDAPDGDFPQRFSGPGPAAGGGIDPRERFLRFYPTGHADDGTATDAVATTVAGTGVTYAEAILSELTTLHPGYDGVDNDDDGATDILGADNTPSTGDEDADEQFVFGAANINTMPEHLAVLSAPYPDTAAATQTLMQAIITQRDSGTQLGFKSIGQLAGWLAGTGAISSATTSHDLYPMFENSVTSGGGTAEYYLIDNDPEAYMKLAQFLTQAYSVRSDIYIAFIVVKGYKSGQFDSDSDGTSDVVESARAIVVFDRGRLTGSTTTDETKELGRYRY